MNVSSDRLKAATATTGRSSIDILESIGPRDCPNDVASLKRVAARPADIAFALHAVYVRQILLLFYVILALFAVAGYCRSL